MGESKKVLITGAAGQISYSLIFLIARGDLLGPDQTIDLHLLDIPPCMNALNGVVMEIVDCAFPLVKNIVPTSDVAVAFKDVDLVFMVGAFPRREGMERKDLLEKNASIFREQGKALDQHAKKTVKVVVVGNPANTNCLLAMNAAPSIPKENFSALTRLDHNRAKAQIAAKLNVSAGDVHDTFIWGNHSTTQYPDCSHGYVNTEKGKQSIYEAVGDNQFLQETFVETVQKRGGAVIKARGLSSAASAANAIVAHMKDWIFGSEEIVSMGVCSDGNPYGVAEGLIYSFPLKCSNGTYSIVSGLEISDFSRKKLQLTEQELLEEKTTAGL